MFLVLPLKRFLKHVRQTASISPAVPLVLVERGKRVFLVPQNLDEMLRLWTFIYGAISKHHEAGRLSYRMLLEDVQLRKKLERLKRIHIALLSLRNYYGMQNPPELERVISHCCAVWSWIRQMCEAAHPVPSSLDPSSSKQVVPSMHDFNFIPDVEEIITFVRLMGH